MTQIPTGTEMARPFVPTKDFALSKAFYEALGFEKVFDGEVAIFRIGTSGDGSRLQSNSPPSYRMQRSARSESSSFTRDPVARASRCLTFGPAEAR